MRNKLTFFFSLFVLLFLIVVANQIQAQTIKVKVRVNTSTNPDTLMANHIVQVRGQSTGTVTPAVTWGTDSGIRMTNVGGDYWETTFQITAGATLNYKFWTGLSPETGTSFNTGWEGNSNGGGGNRIFVAGTKDTTLDLQYYNGDATEKVQYWRPFVSKQDSVAIYFRVNMGGASGFDPAVNKVDVRGGAPLGTDSPWITIKTLSRETGSVNGGSFWSGVAYVAKSAITAGATQQQFKFVIQPENWESVGNRSFTFSGTNDTTIKWYYFNNLAPSGPAVTADVLFRLKLNALEDAGLFNRSLGDKVAITGAKGWPPSGFAFDTEPAMLKMTYNASEEEWNLLESFTRFPKEVIEFKYYISWDTSRVDSTSPNYIRGLDLTNGWEEPGVTGGGNRTFTYTSDTQQILPGDFGNEQMFFNSLDPKGVIKTPIAVTFNINMAPATDVNANATNPLFRPGTDTAYIQFDGSFVPVTQGLPMYGAANRVMLSDNDGNGVYSGTLNLAAPTFNQLCYHVVYTSTSGDIENGGGVLKGRRYYQYLHPSSVTPTSISWPAAVQLPEMQWKNDSLDVEEPPTFATSVRDNKILPGQFSISQNYPNPFNPSTRIQYNIPVTSNVKLQVFDITGRLVKTLSNQEETAGIHMISWNGVDNSGQGVATGIYFLKINAGSYTNTVKMMFLK